MEGIITNARISHDNKKSLLNSSNDQLDFLMEVPGQWTHYEMLDDIGLVAYEINKSLNSIVVVSLIEKSPNGYDWVLSNKEFNTGSNIESLIILYALMNKWIIEYCEYNTNSGEFIGLKSVK